MPPSARWSDFRRYSLHGVYRISGGSWRVLDGFNLPMEKAAVTFRAGRARVTARAIKVVIPPKSNRKVKPDCDFALYCERNLVERVFCIIKHFRAVATRDGKTARNFLAGLHLVCALVWLK